jgi:hypothetical protein
MSNKKKKASPKTPTASAGKTGLERKHVIAIALSAVALVAVVAAIITAIAMSQHKFKFKNGEIVEGNGRIYKPVLMNFRPLQYDSKDPYGELDHPIFGKVELYEVVGTKGGWLYCKEDEVLYRLSSVSVPSLDELIPTSALISTIGTRELSLKETTDSEILEKYLKIISDEANEIEDPGMVPDDTYRLSFRFEEYPFLQYTVSYFQYNDEFFAIYDRNTGIYYPCGDEFYKLLKGADLETGTDTSAKSGAETVNP